MDTIIRQFWTKVEPDGDCLVYTGKRNEHGYGRLIIHGKDEYAHRFAWTLAEGPIPEKQEVLHRCDNPPCVKRAHLFLGTQADNLRDMYSKGRGDPRGRRKHATRISLA